MLTVCCVRVPKGAPGGREVLENKHRCSQKAVSGLPPWGTSDFLRILRLHASSRATAASKGAPGRRVHLRNRRQRFQKAVRGLPPWGDVNIRFSYGFYACMLTDMLIPYAVHYHAHGGQRKETAEKMATTAVLMRPCQCGLPNCEPTAQSQPGPQGNI